MIILPCLESHATVPSGRCGCKRWRRRSGEGVYRAPSISNCLKISATPAYQGTLSLSQASSRLVGCKDPDPAFLVNPVQFGSRVLMTKSWRKKKCSRNLLNIFLWSKITIYLISKIQEKPSLQPSKENIQLFKKGNFLTFFYVCWSFLATYSNSNNVLT